jgi:hypothetical protein
VRDMAIASFVSQTDRRALAETGFGVAVPTHDFRPMHSSPVALSSHRSNGALLYLAATPCFQSLTTTRASSTVANGRHSNTELQVLRRSEKRIAALIDASAEPGPVVRQRMDATAGRGVALTSIGGAPARTDSGELRGNEAPLTGRCLVFERGAESDGSGRHCFGVLVLRVQRSWCERVAGRCAG